MAWAYYNEIDPFAAAWLRELIKAGMIPDGEVDERSIVNVQPGDLRGFRQCHFFAGIGGWPYALRLAGYADLECWTGSCPCQPFSVAGQGKADNDDRDLWPAFYRLIAECRPPVAAGEQVSGKLGYQWLAGVRSQLEGSGYRVGAAIMPACAVAAPHRRERMFWGAVADAEDVLGNGRQRHRGGDCESERPFPQLGNRGDAINLAHSESLGPGWRSHDQDGGRRQLASGSVDYPDEQRLQAAERCREGRPEHEVRSGRDAIAGASGPSVGDASKPRLQRRSWRDGPDGRRVPGKPASRCGERFWSDSEWLTGADGKARRVKSGVRLLANDVPNRVGKLRGLGNAIVAPLAAEFIKAMMSAADA